MKKWQFTLGADVSKLIIDISCSEFNEHIKILNGTQGFSLFKKWCKQLAIDLKNSFLAVS